MFGKVVVVLWQTSHTSVPVLIKSISAEPAAELIKFALQHLKHREKKETAAPFPRPAVCQPASLFVTSVKSAAFSFSVEAEIHNINSPAALGPVFRRFWRIKLF